MEAVGAASSLLAVVTATIQSAKIVYEVVSAIKNGPAAVRRLAKTIDDLLQLLSLFEHFGPRLEANLGLDGRKIVQTFCQKLLECESRMNEMQAMLLPFEKRPDHNFKDRLKRAGKFVLQEKDFDKWQAELDVHTGLLGVYVGYFNLYRPCVILLSTDCLTRFRDVGLANSEYHDIVHSAVVFSSQMTLAQMDEMQSSLENRHFLAASQLQQIHLTQQVQLQQAEVAKIGHQAMFNSLEGRVDELAELLVRKLTLLSTPLEEHCAPYNHHHFQELAKEVEKSLLPSSVAPSTKRVKAKPPAEFEEVSQSGRDDEFSIIEEHDLLPEQKREAVRDRIAESLERLYLTAIPSSDEQYFLNSRDIKDGMVEILNQVLQSTVHEIGRNDYYSTVRGRALMDKEDLNRTMELLRTASQLNLLNNGSSGT